MARASRYDEVKDAVLDRLHTAIRSGAQAPAVRDLADEFGVSVSTMHSWLKKLAAEGMVQWMPKRHHSLKLTQAGLLACLQSSQPAP